MKSIEWFTFKFDCMVRHIQLSHVTSLYESSDEEYTYYGLSIGNQGQCLEIQKDDYFRLKRLLLK